MKIKSHVIATLLISTLVYVIFDSFSAFITSLIGGILIDIDHFFDYYAEEGFSFRIKHFISWCYKQKWQRITLLFHSIELVFILWFIISYFRLGIFWVGFAIGVTQHIVFDIISNNRIVNVFFYFFVFRFIKGFKKECLVREYG